jgi:excisionase family DNA binding protein
VSGDPARVTPLLTVSQAMGVLQVSRATVYRLFEAGELRWVQIGARRRITAAEIERFIAEHCGATA